MHRVIRVQVRRSQRDLISMLMQQPHHRAEICINYITLIIGPPYLIIYTNVD